MRKAIRVRHATLTAFLLIGVGGVCSNGITAGEHPLPQPGDLVFETDFDSSPQREMWSQADFARWKPGYQETTSLCITVPATRVQAGNMIHLPLDLTRYRGCRLLFECMAKAQDVTKPPEIYLGEDP